VRDWRTAQIMFLPGQLDSFRELARTVDNADFLGVAPVALYADFERYMRRAGDMREIESVGTTIAILTRIARDQFEMSRAYPSEVEWVSNESVLMIDSMPVTAAKVIRAGVARGVMRGRGNVDNPWQVLESWAAEEIAS
jgi:hypothetical protein